MKIDRPITIAICLFAVLLLAYFLLMPEYNKFKDLRLELGKRKAEYNAEYQYFSEIANLYSELQSREEDIQKVDDALPSGSNFGNLVYYFQNQALAGGLTVESLFLSKSSLADSKTSAKNKTSGQTQGSMNDIVFSLNLMGSYSSLENFIVSLEKSARLFEVTNISFGSASISSDSEQEEQSQTNQTYNFILDVLTHSY
jgi:Tfp pilus assembly protein PilO